MVRMIAQCFACRIFVVGSLTLPPAVTSDNIAVSHILQKVDSFAFILLLTIRVYLQPIWHSIPPSEFCEIMQNNAVQGH